MNRLLSVISLSIVISCLVACGSSDDNKGAGGAVPGKVTPTSSATAQFNSDMELLAKSGVTSAQTVDDTLNGQFSKVFGAPTIEAVDEFIRTRVKHVLTIEEVTNLTLDIESTEITASGQYKELLDEAALKDLLEGPVGVNFGTGFAQIKNSLNGKIVLHLPAGLTEVKSSRVGLVGLNLNQYTTVTEDIPMPLEGRIEVLAHEGRHSDCADYESANCGYSHGLCPEGHDLAGLYACDEVPWGAYAVGAVYLRATIGNYSPDTLDGRILQFLVDDNISRLKEEHLQIMETTEPDLSSL